MKVHIGDWPRNRPFYDFFEKLGFSNEMNHKIHNFLQSVKLIERERKIKIKLDGWDSYAAGSTLAYIIVPVLKDLKAKKTGVPVCMFPEDHICWRQENESEEEYRNRENAVSAEAEAKWEVILDKMIFAFEAENNEWEDQFWLEEPEIDWEDREVNENGLIPLKWKKEGKFDRVRYDAYRLRIEEGRMLFAKYYDSLWW